MTQLNQMGGNTVVPLTDHFGFGLPAVAGDDTSSGPRVIAVDGDPSGIGLEAPKGSFALDYDTPAIWQATDDVGGWALAGGSGATLSAVLGAGNTTGANNILQAATGVPSTAAAQGSFFVGDGTGGTIAGQPYYREPSDGTVSQLNGAPSTGSLFTSLMASQWGMVFPDAATLETTVSGFGLFGTVFVQDATASGSRSDLTAEGKYFEQDGNIANNPDAVIEGPSSVSNKLTEPRQFPIFNAKFTLTSATADRRAFIGMSSDNVQAYIGAGTDTPTAAYIGFSYSSVRADGNWQLVYDPNPAGAAQNIVDTGVAIALDTPYYYEIEFTSATTAIARILAANNTTVLFSTTISALLPVSTQDMGAGVGTQYIGVGGGNQVLHRFYGMGLQNRGGLSV